MNTLATSDGQKVERVAAPDMFGDLLMVHRLDPKEHGGGLVAIMVEGGEAVWVGTRAQFLELTRTLSEMAVGLVF